MLHYIRGDNQDVGSDAGLLAGVDEIAFIDEAKPARPEIGDRHASDAMLSCTFGTGNPSSEGRWHSPLTARITCWPAANSAATCANSGRLSLQETTDRLRRSGGAYNATNGALYSSSLRQQR